METKQWFIIITQWSNAWWCSWFTSCSFELLFFFIPLSFFPRKCLSMIQYVVYQPNNVSLILISNISIHKTFLFQHQLSFLLSKKEPSDIINVLIPMSDFLFDMCSIFLFHPNQTFLSSFFVTRTYDVKNNESVQRMINTTKKQTFTEQIHAHMISIIIISYFFFYFIEIWIMKNFYFLWFLFIQDER